VDIALLDLSLPNEDGLVLAHSLRAEDLDIGIIILTGRSDTVDRIIGLEIGADDYVVKPVHLRELHARIKSIMRRSRSPNGPAADRLRFRFSGWLLDTSARELFSPTGEHIQLTAGEFNLLFAFVSHPNQLLSRDQLLDQTRGRNANPFDRTIDVQIARLRRKLNEDPKEPRLIKTVRAVGYMLTVPVEVVTENAEIGLRNSQPR
jgi:two-component system OmpR family response regulator